MGRGSIEAKAAQGRIDNYLKAARKELALLQIGWLAPLLFCFTADKNLPLAAEIAVDIAAVSCLAWTYIRFNNIVELRKKISEERGHSGKEGLVAEIMAPLTNRLTRDEKRSLTDLQLNHPLLLLPALQDPKDLCDIESESNGNNGDIISIFQERLSPLTYIIDQLLRPEVKAAFSRSQLTRVEILKILQEILVQPPSINGLKVTGPEANFLAKIVAWGATGERAPETQTKYAESIGLLLESYILQKRVPSLAKSNLNEQLNAAIRAERLTGRSVSPPIEQYREAMRQKKEEKERVIVEDNAAIDLTKSLIAITQGRIPESRETAVGIRTYLLEIFRNERDRLDGKSTDSPYLATINTVLRILDLSINGLFEKNIIDTLLILAPNLREKIKIMPKDIIEGQGKRELGSLEITDNTLVISAEKIFLADLLACSAAILYPHIPRIEIYINNGSNNDRYINTVTEEFYFQRLILGNRSYLYDILFEKQRGLAEHLLLPPIS